MELLLVPVPLFDKYQAVEAYVFQYQLANQSILYPTQKMSPPLDALSVTGVEAFTGGMPIFVPISTAMLENLADECVQSPELITFLLEDITAIDSAHLRSIVRLKSRGYHIAVTQTDSFIDNDALLKQVDCVMMGERPMEDSDRKAMVVRYTRFFKHIRVVATGLPDADAFERAKKDGFALYEGMFFRVPVHRHGQELTPIKANLIRLLNLVRDENFEFKDIADVMRRDPALSYSLMRFINSPFLGIRNKVKSIQHAVTILGQIEVRKWVTAAVFKALGTDRPNELTRISLVRAKFAENLAGLFDLLPETPSLFLMGLFSVLNTMLDTDMATALEKVMVSDDIAEALIKREGKLYPVLQFIVDYERADWVAVLGHSMVHGLFTPDIYTAYLDAVSWYNELITDKVKYIPRSAVSSDDNTVRAAWH